MLSLLLRSPALPAVSTLVDTFTATAQDTTKWVAVGSGTTQPDGTLHVMPASNADGGYRSVNAYSLRNSAVLVQVVQPLALAAGPDGNTQLEIWPDTSSNTAIQFLVQNGTLQAYRAYGGIGGVIGQITYDATLHKWLRIRFANPGGGYGYYFDTWDGTTYASGQPSWVNQFADTTAATTAGVAPDALYVALRAVNNNTGAATIAAQYDNVNVTPSTGVALAPSAATAPAVASVALRDTVTLTPTTPSAAAVGSSALLVSVGLSPSVVTGSASATASVGDADTLTPAPATAPSAAPPPALAVPGQLALTATGSAVATAALSVRATLLPVVAGAAATASAALLQPGVVMPSVVTASAIASVTLAAAVPLAAAAATASAFAQTLVAVAAPIATSPVTASAFGSVLLVVGSSPPSGPPDTGVAIGSAVLRVAAIILTKPTPDSASAAASLGVPVRLVPSSALAATLAMPPALLVPSQLAPVPASANAQAGALLLQPPVLCPVPAIGSALGTATLNAPGAALGYSVIRPRRIGSKITGR